MKSNIHFQHLWHFFFLNVLEESLITLHVPFTPMTQNNQHLFLFFFPRIKHQQIFSGEFRRQTPGCCVFVWLVHNSCSNAFLGISYFIFLQRQQLKVISGYLGIEVPINSAKLNKNKYLNHLCWIFVCFFPFDICLCYFFLVSVIIFVIWKYVICLVWPYLYFYIS